MADYKNVMEVLNEAEQDLQQQLDNIRTAKLALAGNVGIVKGVQPAVLHPTPALRKKLKKHVARGHRYRLKCRNPFCKKGFLSAHPTKSLYCSRKCGYEMFEIRVRRSPKYQVGGPRYLPDPPPALPLGRPIGHKKDKNAYVGQAQPKMTLQDPPKPAKPKPAVLLKGDTLAP